MSRFVSNEQRYSEGELSDSPEFQLTRKADDYESSLSISDEEQNYESLSIKPPQPQGDYSIEENTRRHKKGSSNTSKLSHVRDSTKNKRMRVSYEEKKEMYKEDIKRRREPKHEDKQLKESKKEDLREHLERERKYRKSKEQEKFIEKSGDLRHHEESKGTRKYHGKQVKLDLEKDCVPKSNVKEDEIHRMANKHQRKHTTEISSPEESFQKVNIKNISKKSSHNFKVTESESDEGEASTSTKSSPGYYENSNVTLVADEKNRNSYVMQEDGEPYNEQEEKPKKSEESFEDSIAEVDSNDLKLHNLPLEEVLPPYLPAIMGCRSVSEFQCLNKIEEGTYGVVYRAQDKRTDEIVALKRLKMEREKEGFPITSLREVSTLLKAQHENIVTVREIVVGSNMDSIFMVMDYVEHDLKSLMEVLKSKKQSFLPGEVKCLLQQLLRAVAHLHDNWILHRDLKTSNILLSHSGILKVGDFGLAREYGSPLKAYTSIVVTLWYRAPELLLGVKEYSTPIDVWSVGCIFGELLTLDAIFQGKYEADQINKIFKELGTPNDNIWPGYSELPFVKKASFTNNPVSNLRKRFSSKLSELGVDLLHKFLTYDPAKRISAEEALNHTYLKEPPFPIHPSMLPTWPAKSESNGARKAHSPKPPSGGRAYKQLNEEIDVYSNTGFHMGNTNVDRRANLLGPGFSLKF